MPSSCGPILDPWFATWWQLAQCFSNTLRPRVRGNIRVDVTHLRRSFALLRPTNGEAAAQERLRELILQAYAEYEEKAAVAS